MTKKPPIAVSELDIVYAYRLLLGREPDEKGLAHYLALSRSRSLTTLGLAQIFLASAERNSVIDDAVDIKLGEFILCVDPNEPEFGRHVAQSGLWEPHIMATLSSVLRKGDVFVDVGANIGVMSFSAAAVVGPTGKVIAFEPNPTNSQLFLKSVVRNGLENVIELNAVGLSNRRQLVPLLGGSNSFIAPTAKPKMVIQTVTGDEVLCKEERISAIKIDIEGHEPQAIYGLRHIIARHKPVLIVEFNPRCLLDHSGIEPANFAQEVFALAARVENIKHDGSTEIINSAERLMDLWMQMDKELSTAGKLPPGMLHFDLLIYPS